MKLSVETAPGTNSPKSFDWRGRCYEITSIGRQWKKDDELFMLVMTSLGNVFELAFHTLELSWRVLRAPQDFGQQHFV